MFQIQVETDVTVEPGFESHLGHKFVYGKICRIWKRSLCEIVPLSVNESQHKLLPHHSPQQGNMASKLGRISILTKKGPCTNQYLSKFGK